MFISKEERAKLALKKRQDEVAARKKLIEEKNALQRKYLDEGTSSGRHDNRRQWENRDEDRGKQREESLLLKDREKEVEAIKVILVFLLA